MPAGDAGVAVTLPDGVDPFVALFSESAGRAVVSVPAPEEASFTEPVPPAGCRPRASA